MWKNRGKGNIISIAQKVANRNPLYSEVILLGKSYFMAEFFQIHQILVT